MTSKIKAAVNIEAFARDVYGLEFNSNGIGRCPCRERHNNGDANHSAHLDRQKQRIWCNSQGCLDGKRGVDVFGLVRVLDKCDFPTALRKVADYDGIPIPVNGHSQASKPRIVATFDYKDENGVLLFQVVRKEPGKNGQKKDFVIRQPDGNGGWRWTTEGARLVPYRLSGILKAEGPVVAAEGEQCVDALWGIGIPATTNSMGAGKWREEYNDHFRDLDVVIWPDNDEAGRNHAQQVGKSLLGVARSVRIIDPPDDLPEKGDVVDFLATGKTAADVLALIDSAKPFVAESCSPPPIEYRGEENKTVTLKPRGAADLIQNTAEVTWLVDGVLPAGRCMLLTGPSGTGKSWMSLDMALSVDRGGDWLGRFPCQEGVVLVVDEENGDALLRRRLRKMLIGRGLSPDGTECGIQFLSMSGVNLSDEACVAAMDRVLAEMQPGLVIFDTFVRVHSADESSAKEMAPISRLFKEWFTAYGCAIVLNHHDRKPGVSGHDAQYAFRGSSEIQAFTDTHIDLRRVKGEKNLLNVEHAKARFSEPVEPFGVEIVDVGEGVVVRYTEPHEGQAGKAEEAKEFIRTLLSGGEWATRKDILERGTEAKLSKNTLDDARKALVDADEIEVKQDGNRVMVRLKNSFSSSHTLIGEENKKNDFAEVEV